MTEREFVVKQFLTFRGLLCVEAKLSLCIVAESIIWMADASRDRDAWFNNKDRSQPRTLRRVLEVFQETCTYLIMLMLMRTLTSMMKFAIIENIK